jgi:hypothetical protein
MTLFAHRFASLGWHLIVLSRCGLMCKATPANNASVV